MDNNKTMEDFLSELDEDKKLLNKIAAFRSHLLSFFNKEAMQEEMKRLIDTSSCINFMSERSKRFFSLRAGTTTLHLDLVEAMKKYEAPSEMIFELPEDHEEEIIDFKVSIVFRELCDPLLQSLYQSLIGDDDSKLLNELPFDKKELETFLLTSIFGITCNEKVDSAVTEFQVRMLL
jgi:hypothetical protein